MALIPAAMRRACPSDDESQHGPGSSGTSTFRARTRRHLEALAHVGRRHEPEHPLGARAAARQADRRVPRPLSSRPHSGATRCADRHRCGASWPPSPTSRHFSGLGWASLGVLELTALPTIGAERWVPWVREADVLLVDGGDATYLCHWMRESGLADLLPSLPDTVWVGVSAGSMVMTPRIGDVLRRVAVRAGRPHPGSRRLLDLPAPGRLPDEHPGRRRAVGRRHRRPGLRHRRADGHQGRRRLRRGGLRRAMDEVRVVAAVRRRCRSRSHSATPTRGRGRSRLLLVDLLGELVEVVEDRRPNELLEAAATASSSSGQRGEQRREDDERTLLLKTCGVVGQPAGLQEVVGQGHLEVGRARGSRRGSRGRPPAVEHVDHEVGGGGGARGVLRTGTGR